eukprot:scaffold683_cov124-Cylindrotheca_fusiformis.AAC.14
METTKASKEVEEKPSASSPAKEDNDSKKPVVSPENEPKASSTNQEPEEAETKVAAAETNQQEEELTAKKNATNEDSTTAENDDDADGQKKRKAESTPTENGTTTKTTDGDDEEDSKKKKTQDDDAPAVAKLPPRPLKRARTAYFIFMDETRPEVQAQHPGEGVAAVAKALGQRWNAMSVDEKKAYQEKAALERERVRKELEAWKAAGGTLEVDATSSSTSGRRLNDPLALDFPVARVRKICKLDPEVRGLSKEALLLVTKCAEMALQKLGTETVRVAQLQNRRKLLPEDVAHVCGHREQFLFLKDDVKDLLRDMQKSNATSGAAAAAAAPKVDPARQAAAAGSKPLTSYFGAAPK